MAYSDNSTNKQEQLYKMLDYLKNLAKEIPAKYQQRLPYDVLSSLAQLLLNDTVFEIVQELVDLQHMTEKHLLEQRHSIVYRHKTERDNLISGHRDEVLNAKCQGRQHVLDRLPVLQKEQVLEMEGQQKDELTKFDFKIVQDIDEKVQEQQSTLQQVGVPGFKVTKDPLDIRIQMFILDFILKLGSIKTGT